MALIELSWSATASKLQKHKIHCGLAAEIGSRGFHSLLYLYITPILLMLGRQRVTSDPTPQYKLLKNVVNVPAQPF